MRRIKAAACSAMLMAFLLTAPAGCERASGASTATPRYTSFRSVPGVTQDEIRAIEELRRHYSSFVYGTTPNSEAFEGKNGDISGYSALFCDWLSELFNIPFVPSIYSWGDLIAGLDSGAIDFTGELTASDPRRDTYLMTDAIARRSLKYFRIQDSPSLQNIRAVRPLRFAFLEGTTTIKAVEDVLEPGTFEIIPVKDSGSVYSLLKSGEIDAFINENPGESVFDTHIDVVSSDFFPIIITPVSLSTQNPAFAPIISVVQKALENGAEVELSALYAQGLKEYKMYRFFSILNDEEKAYIRTHNTVRLAAEHYNYPISFYNKRDKQWQGIFFDVLEEVQAYTGLTFERINNQQVEWPTLLRMLENGEVSMISELLHSEDREGKFLWADTPLVSNHYALLSKSKFRNIRITDVYNVRVGAAADTVYAELFKSWFPNHQHLTEYESSDDTFKALDKGAVDMVMSSYSRLLAMTNYYELSGYKANITFGRFSESTMGFNVDERILCSIINKALHLIDVTTITEQWLNKTYDYNAKLNRDRRPFLIGLFALLSLVIVLLSVLSYTKHHEGLILEKQVKKRTAELQKVREDLEVAAKAAQAASFSKTVFLANMSHEIRTPMNSIIGFSELAMDDDISEKTREYLSRIIENSNWLLTMLNDVLDISKIEAGKMELETIPFDLHEIFTHCQTATVPKAIEKGINLYFYAEPTIGKRLLGDPTRLHQIFINLLSNAIKFTNIGVVKLSSFVVDQDDDSATLCFEVRDSGIGMTPEQLEKVFKPFVQGDSSMTRLHGGTGLGLSITKNLIEMMGGTLEVESTYKVGTKFSFELTFKTKDIEDDVASPTVAIDEIEKPFFDGGEILICEDNQMNQRVIIEHLARVGLKAVIAANGKIGVETVQARKLKGEKPFDLIFMDIHMPVMDGLEAAPKIVELNTGAPIVAMTANIMSNDMDLYKASGIPDCISKPFTSQELWRCLLRYLKPAGIESVNKDQQAQAEEALRQQLLADFVNGNQTRYDEIVKALDGGDIKTAHRLAHSLKGNAGNIGKTALQKAAASVEASLKDGANTLAPEQMSLLKSELTAVLKELAPLLKEPAAEPDDAPIQTADIEKARELLERLEPLLNDGNTESLKFVGDLRSIPGSAELIKQIDNFDFKPALAALAKLKGELGVTK